MLTNAEADQLGLAIGRLARRLRTESMGGLTPSQRSLLATLHRHGPQTMSALARLENVSAPSITRIATRLAEAGLVKRADHPEDGRSTVVDLTDEGREVLEAGRRERLAFLVTQLERLAPNERRLLSQAVDIFTRMADG